VYVAVTTAVLPSLIRPRTLNCWVAPVATFVAAGESMTR
jgi:hypothetical protein